MRKGKEGVCQPAQWLSCLNEQEQEGEDNEGRTRVPFMAFETETGTRPNRKASRSEKITGERETHTREGMDIPGLWETPWSKRTKNKCVWSFVSSSSSSSDSEESSISIAFRFFKFLMTVATTPLSFIRYGSLGSLSSLLGMMKGDYITYSEVTCVENQTLRGIRQKIEILLLHRLLIHPYIQTHRLQ